jgi:protein-L-isoaspartate(D-aspartate) O-methyltransferase
MVTLAADFLADARKHMVDSQVRPNRVNDPAVLSAMRTLPREAFLPASLAALAYADEDVPLGDGRVLMEPLVIAKLIQLAAPQPGERALVVAAGTGYGAAILAACGARVTALEEDPRLSAIAAEALMTHAPGVSLVSGPLAAGWPSGGPYDIILLEGAVPAIPPALGSQLRADGGRLVGVLSGPSGRTGQAVLAEASVGGLRTRSAFDCATPLLPSFRPAPAFTF